MAAGKELLGSYKPEMVHAGDYPVVTGTGTVSDGSTIPGLMPVVLGTDGKLSPVTASTVTDVYGIAADSAEAGEEVVIYLTGQFFGDALELPEGVTAPDLKAPLRKIGIFLEETENKAGTPGKAQGTGEE